MSHDPLVDFVAAWFEAAKAGDVKTMWAIAAPGWDVNRRDRFGTTALHWAAVGGRTAAVAFLLKGGADREARDAAHQRTPLQRAVAYGHVGAALELLAHGAMAEVTSSNGRTPLHAACADGHVDLVAPLLEHGADPNRRAPDGSTPMLLALRNHRIDEPGATAMLAPLLARGADPNVLDDRKNSPISIAVEKGWPQAVRMLLGAGADANGVTGCLSPSSPRGDYGYNPLGWIDVPLVHVAVRTPGVLQMLLDAGADLFARTRRGHTVLHHAAGGAGTPAVIKYLLGRGLLDERDEEGWTALHHAAAARRPDVIRLLLRAGADVNRADGWGLTPLHVAAGTPPPAIDLDSGTCVVPPVSPTENPLWQVRRRPDLAPPLGGLPRPPRWPDDAACVAHYVATVREMLEANADRTARDAVGRTPADVTGFATVKRVLMEAVTS